MKINYKTKEILAHTRSAISCWLAMALIWGLSWSGGWGQGNTSFSLNSNSIGGLINVGIGFYTLQNTTGWGNSSLGYSALIENLNGNYNSGFGAGALYRNKRGSNNTGIGTLSLQYNTLGNCNTAVGANSMEGNSTGKNNTTIGFRSNVGDSTLENATSIGYRSIVTTKNAIQLGNDSVTHVYAGVADKARLVAGRLQIIADSPGPGKVLAAVDNTGLAIWKPISESAWVLDGNIANANSFLGTKNTVPLNIRVNNQKAGRIDYQVNVSNSGNTYFGYQVANTSTGRDNVAIGYWAMFNNTTGSYNVANGFQALSKNTTGARNVAFGHFALGLNQTGSRNTADGQGALQQNTTGSGNTGVGNQALNTNVSGNCNTAIGYDSDVSQPNLSNATAIGCSAIVTANNSIQMGNAAVTKVNVGVGNNATLVTGGIQVTGGSPGANKVLTSDANGVGTWQAVGATSGWGLTGNSGTTDVVNFIGTTDSVPLTFRLNSQMAGRLEWDPLTANTFWGFEAGLFALNTNAVQNTAIGYNAMKINSGGDGNVALGVFSLENNDSGGFNTAVGFNTLSDNISGSNNTAVGNRADVGSGALTNATAIGAGATVEFSNAVQLGNSQVDTVFAGVGNATTLVVGRLRVTGGNPIQGKVLKSTGANGLATWQDANAWELGGNSNATSSSFIGTPANVAITLKIGNNVAGKVEPGLSVANTFWGYEAGKSIMPSNGSLNTGLGFKALTSNTTGDENVAVGVNALEDNTIGRLNTAIGTNALVTNDTASCNTALGAYANIDSDSIQHSTAIGCNAIVAASYQIQLGSGTVTHVTGTGTFNTTSDGRFKTNIREEVSGLAFIQKLRPVVYNFDTRRFTEFLTQNMPDSLAAHYLADDFGPSTAIRQSGFIAQEVEQAAKEVGYNFNGVHVPADSNDNYSLAYAQFVVPLVKGMQEQQAMIETRDAEVHALKSELAAQAAQLDELKALVNKMAQTCCPASGAPAQGGTKADAPAMDPAAPTHPVEVFPNPSLGRFTLRIAPLETGHVEVFDQRGVQVHRQALTPGQTEYTIDLSGMASGSYLLRLHSHCGVVATKQLVVE